MHEAPDHSNAPIQVTDTSRSSEQRERPGPGLLSQSDPEPTRSSRRPPAWLLLVVLLVIAFAALHLSGAIK